MLRQSPLLTFITLVSLVHSWPALNRIVRHNTRSLYPRYTNGTSTNWTDTNGTHASWPPVSKIRGVNLGSLFIIEPWMLQSTWNDMGCGGYGSEADCMAALGQEQGDSVFQNHWSNFITEEDFDEMLTYGINTVRIPVGYWMYEKLVYEGSETFPRGGFEYLRKIASLAKAKGIYVILDMHGAPGAQVANNAFTGQIVDPPGFYETDQYDRGVQFLEWLTEMIWSYDDFGSVFMLEVLNEPVAWGGAPDSLRSYFYEQAYTAIRAKENSLGIDPSRQLYVQFMNSLWGSGDPTEDVKDGYQIAFDDHRYLKWLPEDQLALNQDDYIRMSCGDNRQAEGENPTIVAEFSLGVSDQVEASSDWSVDGNSDFYQRWFAAQIQAYEERASGWVFWSWKTELGDPRWDYKHGNHPTRPGYHCGDVGLLVMMCTLSGRISEDSRDI